MKERMKELRKSLGMTQKEFAEKIGVKQNTVAVYEIGRNPPTDTVVSLICRAFGVNEQWLRTGEGEMFAAKGDSIDDLMTRYQLHPRCRRILETVLALPEPAQEAFCDFLDGLKREAQKEETDLREQVKAEVRAEVEAEALEKARQEVRAELEQERNNL